MQVDQGRLLESRRGRQRQFRAQRNTETHQKDEREDRRRLRQDHISGKVGLKY